MAHDLETQNGKTSFASFREPAWHGLGTVFTEEKTTAEMLEAANKIALAKKQEMHQKELDEEQNIVRYNQEKVAREVA